MSAIDWSKVLHVLQEHHDRERRADLQAFWAASRTALYANIPRGTYPLDDTPAAPQVRADRDG